MLAFLFRELAKVCRTGVIGIAGCLTLLQLGCVRNVIELVEHREDRSPLMLEVSRYCQSILHSLPLLEGTITRGDLSLSGETSHVIELNRDRQRKQGRRTRHVPTTKMTLHVKDLVEPLILQEPTIVPPIQPKHQPEQIPEPQIELTPKPQIELTPKPQIELTPKPQIELTPKPQIKLTPKPQIELTPKPQIELTPKPQIGLTPKPQIELTPEPQPEQTPEPQTQADIGPSASNS
ncbi:hypothetical protein H6P81_003414 [Aristolochia fimbriata]|uniref:Uncharacterized protein n=1 Tax=Aristolochia fimbriata TaxID=158543 RepID=A0AAV7FFS0_ARIFI|nr:hypothetical protein H6P81_003414 [Aristolochia fimbriata]